MTKVTITPAGDGKVYTGKPDDSRFAAGDTPDLDEAVVADLVERGYVTTDEPVAAAEPIPDPDAPIATHIEGQ